MVTIGQMRDRVVIQGKTTVPDGQGGRAVTWAALSPQPTNGLAAKVKPLSASERIQAAAVGSMTSYLVTIRYRADVTASMRVSWRPYLAPTAKVLQINGVTPLDGGRAWLELACAEVA